MATKKTKVVNPKQHVIEEIAALLDPLKKLYSETIKKCEKLSEKHGVPFKIEYEKAYFPKKIDPEALVGTEFEWIKQYADDPHGMIYEGEGWSSSYC